MFVILSNTTDCLVTPQIYFVTPFWGSWPPGREPLSHSVDKSPYLNFKTNNAIVQ